METATEKVKALASIRADKIDTSKLEHNILLFQLGAGSLRYAVADTKKNRCLVLEEFKLNPPRDYQDAVGQLVNILDHTEVLRLEGWKEIRISFVAGKFSLVPLALYDENVAPEFLGLLAPHDSNSETVLDYKHKDGIVDVFAASKRMLGFFTDTFGDKKIRFVPQTSLLIEGVLHLAASLKGKPVMLVKIDADHITLAAASGNNLLICNVYSTTNENDIAYYVMLAIKELGLDANDLPVYLCGDTGTASASYQKLYNYISDLKTVTKPGFLNLSSSFSEANVIRFYDLFCLYLAG